MQCSPNPCFDPAAPGNQQTTTQNDAMLQNDGPKDAAGNCLGQLYIFNGKPSRCRPPGLRVGMINNCCDSDETVSEDLGTSIQTVANTIQTAYEIGQVAYYGNALVTGAAEIASISTTATGAVTSMTVVTATGTTATLSGATAAGAYGAVASGTTGVSAMTAGIEAYAGALLNPATIVVAVVVMVVMRVLFGNGCDEKYLQTGSQVAGKDCHYVGVIAVHQQDMAIAGIDNLQFRHGTAFADLADGQTAAVQCFLEGEVLRSADCGAEERDHRQFVVDQHLPQFQIVRDVPAQDRVHSFLFVVVMARFYQGTSPIQYPAIK